MTAMRSFIFDLGYKGNFSCGRWRMGAEVVEAEFVVGTECDVSLVSASALF